MAIPATVVRGSSNVERSENPTTQVGSAAAMATQSSSGRISTASSPPHGGTIARMSGSSSMSSSSAARSAAGALTSPSPSMQSPTVTSYPRDRTTEIPTSSRGTNVASTPDDGAVTPIRSPGFRGRGVRRSMGPFYATGRLAVQSATMADALFILAVGAAFVVLAPVLARFQIRLLTRGRDAEPSGFLVGILRATGVALLLVGIIALMDIAFT